MNFLTINIAIILVSATVLHFLLFKKSIKGVTKRYLFPANSYREKIVEVISIISLLGIILIVAMQPTVNSFFIFVGLFITLILIFRMVRTNGR